MVAKINETGTLSIYNVDKYAWGKVAEGSFEKENVGLFLICNLQNYVGEQKFSYNTSYIVYFYIVHFYNSINKQDRKTEQETPGGFKLKMNHVRILAGS